MPFEVIPSAEDPRIVFSRYYGAVTVEDVQGVTDAVLAHIASTNVERVNILMSFEDVESYPNKLREIVPAARGITDHEKMGWWVLWGINDTILSFLVQMVARVSRIRFRQVSNRDEALEFIEPILRTISD